MFRIAVYKLSRINHVPKKKTRCPKCGAVSGDDWSQCKGRCPMPASPYYVKPKEETK